MSAGWVVLLVVLGGVCVAVQPPVNAALAGYTGLMEAIFVSFLVGTLAIGGVLLASGSSGLFRILSAPTWTWTGGLIGALYVWIVTFAVSRLGIATALVVAVASQMVAGMVLDHYGLLGLKEIPMDSKRVCGCLLVFAGVWLMRDL